MKLIGGAALAAAALMSGGCGGGNDSPAEGADASDSASVAVDTPSPAASSTPKKVDAKPYFTALAANDPDQMMKAAKRAAPGSLARAYMVHQAYSDTADLDNGADVAPEDLTRLSDGYKLCADSDDDGEETCYTYDKFKVSPSGQLASFSVNGRSITGRVVLGNGKAVDSSPASVTVLSAYQTASGYLTVAVKVRTHDAPIVFFDPTATYRTPSGQQRAVSGQSGQTDLDADSTATQLYFFKGQLKFGGTISLQVATHPSTDNYGDTTYVKAPVG